MLGRRNGIAGALALLCSGVALGKANGIAAPSCAGCHPGPRPMVTLSANNMNPALGSTVRLTVAIQALNGNTGGLYLRRSEKGTFALVGGQSTQFAGGNDQIMHTTPKQAAGGSVTFQVDWQTPNAPGGVDFDVVAVSGNGNGNAGGDGEGSAKLSFSYGCAEGKTYYRDFDNDGVGSAANGVHRDCAKLEGFAEVDGDCDDNDGKVHPGAAEVCNGRDDNCNGAVDEGTTPKSFYPDKDGDGYGAPGGSPKTGCVAPAGYGVGNEDCNDNDPKIHPEAAETCNDRDDDCDGRVDENVRPTCGVGLCTRAAISCTSNVCTPGKPTAETCNALDDDCDGVVDNGANLCPNGGTCVAGLCPGQALPDGGTVVEPPANEGGGGCQSAGGSSLAMTAVFALALLQMARLRLRR